MHALKITFVAFHREQKFALVSRMPSCSATAGDSGISVAVSIDVVVSDFCLSTTSIVSANNLVVHDHHAGRIELWSWKALVIARP